jgi:SAM-dependent methyltransferase
VYAEGLTGTGAEAKQVAPAAERNKGPIIEVLQRLAGGDAVRMLEVASGTGQHAAHFVSQLPAVSVQPTDFAPDALASIAAYRAEAGEGRLLEPRRLDMLDRSSWEWVEEGRAFDLVFCANMIHISPPATTPALLEVSARALRAGGLLVLYGPFNVGGAFTSPGNEAFDAKLKAMNASYGLKDVADVSALAEGAGLHLREVVEMPANNKTLVFVKA